LEILDVLVVSDDQTRGDFWRAQPWVALPKPEQIRPESFTALAAAGDAQPLKGVRIAVPRMFVGTDLEQGTGTGMGSSTGKRIEPRPSMMTLWEAARADLEAAGAELVESEFPVVSNYEADRASAPNVFNRGIVPAEFFDHEIWDLCMWSWHDFLASNGQAGLSSLAEVDGPQIFPRHPDDVVPDQYLEFDADIADYVTRARRDGIIEPFTGAQADLLRRGLEALEETRRLDLEAWMSDNGFDAVVFPTLADIAPADMDKNPESSVIGWKNGVWVANGNLAIRHLGVPTVNVTMGTASDIGMPFGLTFAGKAYSDGKLLALAAVFENLRARRTAPTRTPEL
jgi:amidase